MIKLSLKTLAKQSVVSKHTVLLTSRLPSWIESNIELDAEVFVQAANDYYELSLNISGSIPVTCQRCLAVFQHQYNEKRTFVACEDEQVAVRLMAQHEPIVTSNGELDLADLVTDELYFSSPDRHLDPLECNSLTI